MSHYPHKNFPLSKSFYCKLYFSDGTIYINRSPRMVDPFGDEIPYLHREDGPAVEYQSGSEEWYINGKLHRIGGPAINYVSGHIEFWIDNKIYSKHRYYEVLEEVNKMDRNLQLVDPRWWVREIGKQNEK